MRIAKVLAFCLLTISFWGCKKNEMSPIPVIKYIKQSTNSLIDSSKQNQGPIIFTFDFEDGDSDIGPIDNPIPLQNIYFIDSRDSAETLYNFPPIPGSVVSNDGIKGSFIVEMNPVTIFPRTDTTTHKFTDTVRWRVFVRDGQDNFSNEVLTDSIVIFK